MIYSIIRLIKFSVKITPIGFLGVLYVKIWAEGKVLSCIGRGAGADLAIWTKIFRVDFCSEKKIFVKE